MRNTFATILLAAMTTVMCQAQDPVSSQHYSNTVIQNPANVTFLDDRMLAVNYRNQWPGYSVKFHTLNLAYHHPFATYNGGMGLLLSNDAQGSGIINKTGITLIYSHKINLNRNNRMHVALSGNFMQHSYNYGGLQLEDPNESLYNEHCMLVDFGVGTKLNIKSLYLGLAVFHATPSIGISGLGELKNIQRRFVFETGFRRAIKENSVYREIMFIEPSLLYSHQGNTRYLNWGTNLIYNQWQTGMFIRHDFSFDVDSFIISFGILQSTYNFVYSYDFRAPWNMKYYGKTGAHEVTFSWRFQYNKKSKKTRTINCPDI